MPEVPTLASLASSNAEPSPSLFLSDSRHVSPERPLNIRRKTGSTLALNQLAKVPENIARSGEKLARESLDPRRYHRESAALKAAKSRDNSPSTPGTPKYEMDEKTPVRRRKKDKKRQEEIFITSEDYSYSILSTHEHRRLIAFSQCTSQRFCKDKTLFFDLPEH